MGTNDEKEAPLKACAYPGPHEQQPGCLRAERLARQEAWEEAAPDTKNWASDKSLRGPWNACMFKEKCCANLDTIAKLRKENDLLRKANPNMATSLVKMAHELEAAERELAGCREALQRFSTWRRPTKQDWENGAVQNEFDNMQREAREALNAASKAKAAWDTAPNERSEP